MRGLAEGNGLFNNVRSFKGSGLMYVRMFRNPIHLGNRVVIWVGRLLWYE